MVRLGDKGGYDCGFALEDVRMFRDALSWLEDQAGQQYGNVADRGRLVGEMVFRAYRVPSRSGLCDHADAAAG